MKKIIIGIAVIILIVVGVSYFGKNSSQPSVKEPIKIGVIAPLSGEVASLGENAKNGATLAYDELSENVMQKIQLIFGKFRESFLFYVGCHYERKKGDHRIYGRSDLKRPIVFPEDKEIPVFIIRNNLRVLGISHNEFLNILEKL